MDPRIEIKTGSGSQIPNEANVEPQNCLKCVNFFGAVQLLYTVRTYILPQIVFRAQTTPLKLPQLEKVFNFFPSFSVK